MTATLSIPVSIAKDLLTGAEWSPGDVRDLLHRTAEIKARPAHFASVLRGKHIALIFEKPSLRTRVTFEVGIQSMGGFVVFLDHTQARLGERESIPDVARNLQRWVHGIVARVYEQRVLEEKFGSLRGFKLAYVGDGNNVCHSLIFLAARLGVNIRIATPASYTPDADVLADARRVAKETRSKIELFTDPAEAVAGAQAVYTDSWTSMGFEAEEKIRRNIFKPYQVNRKLMEQAAENAVFMHCLPAHRGAEVTDEVLDGPSSIVLDQSENRMYVQKAILHALYS